MTTNHRKLNIIRIAIILVLISFLVLGGLEIIRAYTSKQAQNTALQYLPSTAAFVSYNDTDEIFVFRFFDASQQERSEIEVDKSSGDVRKIQTQKAAYVYPDSTALQDDALKEIIWKEVPDAAINNVTLHEQTDGTFTAITYTAEDSRGEYLIDPANGTVIARTVKYGRPVVIPSSANEKIDLLSLAELKAIGNQKIPGAVFQDLDIAYDNGKFVAEIDMYTNGIKHVLVLDAGSGEELAYHSYTDDWKTYGSWEPRELETPLLDIVNLNSSLELTTSTGPDQTAVPSDVTDTDQTQPAAGETTAAIPSETTGTNPGSSSGLTPTPQITSKPTAAATSPAATAAVTSAPTAPVNADPAVISLDRAKALVLSRLPDAVFDEIDLDEDDGRLLYKGKAISGQTEVDFEIDAYTGTFAKWDVDTNDD